MDTASPRRFVDLHAHSTASDGSDAPAELVRKADARGLAAVALTDHDTTAGLAEARAAAKSLPDLRFVAGVEVSAVYEPGTMHVLGLGIDESAGPLQRMTARFRAARRERNPRILARLRALGVPVSMEDVCRQAGRAAGEGGGIISRLHIAQAIVAAGRAADRKDAFARYVGAGAPAYVAKERLAAGEIIAAIHAASGAAVLAHPVQLQCPDLDAMDALVRRLMDAGLDGIEAYHSDHSDEQTRQYIELARRHGLLITGGSDYHGPGKPHVALGRPAVPAAILDEPWASRWLADERLS